MTDTVLAASNVHTCAGWDDALSPQDLALAAKMCTHTVNGT